MAKPIKLSDKELDIVCDALRFQACSNKKWLKIIDKIKRQQKRIKISSAKAKGRNLQKWTLEKIAKLLGYKLSSEKDANLIRSREMGQAGTDIVIGTALRYLFPFAVECKATETIALPAFIEQAKSNTSETLPYMMLVIKNKSMKEPIICIEWEGIEFLGRGVYNK